MPAALDQGRVQAPEIADPEALRPGGLAPDVSTGAPRPVEDNTLGQLAESLGQFHSSVRRLGQYQAREQYYQNREGEQQDRLDAQDQVAQLRATKSPAEIIDMANKGQLPHFNSLKANLYVDASAGLAMSDQIATQYDAAIKSGTITPDQGPTWLANQRQQMTNGLDPNSGRMRAFNNKFADMNQRAAMTATTYQADQQYQAQRTAYYGNLTRTIQHLHDSGVTDPAEVWKSINEVHQNADAASVNIPLADRDGMVVQALENMNDPSYAVSVLNAPRQDVKDPSKSVPAIGATPAYAGRMRSLQNQAIQNQVADADTKAAFEKQTEVGALFDNNPTALAAMKDVPISYTNPVTGQSKVLTGAIQQAAQATIQRDAADLAAGRKNADQVVNEELDKFSSAGLTHPMWAAQFKAVGDGAANPQSLSDPAKAGQLAQTMDLYRKLYDKNPAYLRTIVSDQKTRQFFDNSLMQQRMFGESPVQAMQQAAQYQNTDKPDLDPITKQNQQAAISSAISSDVHNGSVILPELTKATDFLMRTRGMNATDAVNAAKDYITRAYPVVNGYMVPTNGALPNDQMEPTVKRYLNDFATGPAKSLGLDPSNLAIAPVGPDEYKIVYANNGLPVVNPKRGAFQGSQFVTTHDLQATWQNMIHEQQTSAATGSDIAAAKAADVRMRQRDQSLINQGTPSTSSFTDKALADQARRREEQRIRANEARSNSSNAPDTEGGGFGGFINHLFGIHQAN